VLPLIQIKRSIYHRIVPHLSCTYTQQIMTLRCRCPCLSVESQIAYADIKEIKKIGRGKILAEMITAANRLTNNSKLEKKGLRAFIPTYRIIRTGIVKNIPQHIDEAGLLEFFNSPCKVTEVRWLNRCIRTDGETKYIPSRTVCLKFAG